METIRQSERDRFNEIELELKNRINILTISLEEYEKREENIHIEQATLRRDHELVIQQIETRTKSLEVSYLIPGIVLLVVYIPLYVM